MDTTGIVLGVIVTLVGMVIGIIKLNNDRFKSESARLVESTKTNVHLEQIQKEMVEIKILLSKYDDVLRLHTQEISDLKNEIKGIKKDCIKHSREERK